MMAVLWKTMPYENGLKELRMFSLLNNVHWYDYRQNKENGIYRNASLNSIEGEELPCTECPPSVR